MTEWIALAVLVALSNKEGIMKRTYVDLVGEYYDNAELIEEAAHLGLRQSELRKVYREKIKQRKQRVY